MKNVSMEQLRRLENVVYGAIMFVGKANYAERERWAMREIGRAFDQAERGKVVMPFNEKMPDDDEDEDYGD